MIHKIQDAISISVIGVHIIPIILFINTQNPIHIKAFIGSFAASITEYIKYNVIGKNSIRPEGAKDCNLMCNDGDMSGKPGMPSGHSVSAVFFSGFYFQNTNNNWIRIILVLYAVLIMYSRYYKKCHTINQISAGALFGLFLSWIINKI